MMMGDQLILEEDYDEHYQPTEEEIREYAQVIGIEVDREPHLMWIAREGINAPLPQDWKPCQDQSGSGDIYYFNFASGESMWDHPCDEYYRNMVTEERKKPIPSKQMPQKKDKKKKDKKEKDFKKFGKEFDKKPQGSLGPLKGEVGGSFGGMPGTMGSTTGAPNRLMRSDPLATTAGLTSTFGSKVGSTSKSGGFELTGTGRSFLKGSRGEHIQMLDMDDEETESPRLDLKLDMDLNDVGQLGYETSEPEEELMKLKSDTSGDTDDNGSVDFGISPILSDRLHLMEAENLTPVPEAVTPKMSSTLPSRNLGDVKGLTKLNATTGSLKKKILLPEDKKSREEEERRKRAEIQANAAQKRFNQNKTFKDDEEKMRKEHEKILSDLKERLNKELENAKLDLMNDKEDALKSFKKKMKEEQEKAEAELEQEKEAYLRSIRKEVRDSHDDEEARLQEGKSDALRKMRESVRREQQDEEKKLRDELAQSMTKLKEELQDLQKNEREKLEEEKKKAMDKIEKEVSESVDKEKKKLEEKKNKVIEECKQKLDKEEQEALEEIGKLHSQKIDQKKSDLVEKHQRAMDDLLAKLQEAQDEDRKTQEAKLKATREKQSAVEELQDGLENVLKEKKHEMKESHKKELDNLTKQHERDIKKIKQENEDKEIKEKKSFREKLEAEKKKMSKEHDKILNEMRKQFEEKKDKIHEKHEEQDGALKEMSEALERRKKELQRELKQVEKEEKSLDRRQERLREDMEKFDQEQDEAFVKRAGDANAMDLEKLRAEKRRLQNDIRELKKELQDLKKLKSRLESDIKKLKRSREEYDKKSSDSKHVEENDEDIAINGDVMRTPKTPGLKLDELAPPSPDNEEEREMVHPRDFGKSDEEDIQETTGEDERDNTEERRPKRKTDRDRSKRSGRRSLADSPEYKLTQHRLAWNDVPSDSDESDDLTPFHHRGYKHQSDLKVRLVLENDAIGRAKEFLRRQRNSLKRRQLALQEARQELRKDLTSQQLDGDDTADGASFLEDVKVNLEKEALELDKAMVNMSAGHRLVKEKEQKLKLLEESLAEATSSPDNTEMLLDDIESRLPPRNRIPDFLSDSENSSGVSSSDFAEDHIQGKQYRQQQSSRLLNDLGVFETKLKSKRKGKSPTVDFEPISSSLNKINKQLDEVMGVLTSQSKPNTQLANNVYSQSATLPYQPYYATSVYPTLTTPVLSQWQGRTRSAPDVRFDPVGIALPSQNETTEQMLERKWKTYFGAHKPVFNSTPAGPVSSNSVYGSSYGGYIPARERLRDMGSSGHNEWMPQPGSTETMLQQQSDWLKEFTKSSGIGQKLKPSDNASLSNYSVASSSSGNVANRMPFAASNPEQIAQTTHPKAGKVRLELDEHNQLQIRQY
ncbi:centrosomal protein of 164 kDa-like [Ptychodera flava]|uniref:centrosomal protein of 164 kDa-like n=1 Tax=Ptychodera flava TaxID=63121 RepID=UPI00396A2B13